MTEKHIHTLSALSLSSSHHYYRHHHHHHIIARGSLERQSLWTFVNRCCNVLCDCAGQCTSGSPPLHTAQMTLEEARQSGAVIEASALPFIFLVTFFVSFLNYLILWPSPAGTMTLGIFRVVWMNFAFFEVTFARVLEPQNKAPDLPDSCRQLSV